MVKLPHEVKEAQVVGFPAIKFEVSVAYNANNERYNIYVQQDDGFSVHIGSFPTDVAHILLNPMSDFLVDAEDN